MNHEATVEIMLLAWSLAVVTLFVCQTGVEDRLGSGFAFCRPFTRMPDASGGMQHVSILESQSNLRDTALYWQVRRALELFTGLATFCGVARARKPDPSQIHSCRDHWQMMIPYILTGPSARSFMDSLVWFQFGVQRHGLSPTNEDLSEVIFNPSLDGRVVR